MNLYNKEYSEQISKQDGTDQRKDLYKNYIQNDKMMIRNTKAYSKFNRQAGMKGTTSIQDLYNKDKSIYNNDRHKINTNTWMNLTRQTP